MNPETQTPLPETPPEPTVVPEPTNSVIVPETQKKKVSILRIIITIIVIVVLFVVLVSGWFAHSVFTGLSNLCGENSQVYKDLTKKAETITLVSNYSAERIEFTDTSKGTCNLDVKQEYTAIKVYDVSMSGEAALEDVQTTLAGQAYKRINTTINGRDCNNIGATVSYVNRDQTKLPLYVTFESDQDNCDMLESQSSSGKSNQAIWEETFLASKITSISTTVPSL